MRISHKIILYYKYTRICNIIHIKTHTNETSGRERKRDRDTQSRNGVLTTVRCASHQITTNNQHRFKRRRKNEQTVAHIVSVEICVTWPLCRRCRCCCHRYSTPNDQDPKNTWTHEHGIFVERIFWWIIFIWRMRLERKHRSEQSIITVEIYCYDFNNWIVCALPNACTTGNLIRLGLGSTRRCQRALSSSKCDCVAERSPVAVADCGQQSEHGYSLAVLLFVWRQSLCGHG